MAIYTPSTTATTYSKQQAMENANKYGLDNQSGSDADYSELQKEMYEEYLKIYLPIQQQMIQNLLNENYGKDLLSMAQANNQLASVNAKQGTQFTNERLGVDSLGSESKQRKLDLALANAKNNNAIRSNEEDRKLYLLTGSNSSTLKDLVS